MAGDRTTGGNRDIWLLDLVRDGLTRLTTHPAVDGFPLWSPDGSRLAFHSARKGTIDLWIMPSSGAGAEELLLEQPDSEWPVHWSRDGRVLLYQRSDLVRGGWDLWALPMTGSDRTPFPVANTPFVERLGEFSPNGRWIAYDTNESGRSEIVVQSFPEPRGRLAVSISGGAAPRWSADGTEIYFLAPDGRMMAVPVHPKASTLEFGTPAALFATHIFAQTFKFQYAVSREGRFMINNVLEAPAPPIVIILNAKPG